MLTFFSSQSSGKMCDGISRRSFLQVGGLCVGGLTLADVLRLRASGAASQRVGNKAVIMIYLEGGPSHLDMYDLKPDAPAEFRGEYRPIRTSIPGFDICEKFPLQAQIADKLAVIRNMQFGNTFHNGPLELETGFIGRQLGARASRPGIGSVVSRLERDARSSLTVPRYVAFHSHAYTAYLGNSHRPFNPGRDLQSLTLNREITLERLNERTHLMWAFDGLNRNLDTGSGELPAIDAFTGQALEMITAQQFPDLLFARSTTGQA